MSEELAKTNTADMVDEESGEAVLSSEAIILRWRIHKGELSLRRRHFRALDELELPRPLRGWIFERLEWAIANMLHQGTEAVLVLSIDPKSEVTISLDELSEAPSLSFEDLIEEDGFVIGVQKYGKIIDGTIWVERDDTLYASIIKLNSATDTLARDLAETLKISAIIERQRVTDIKDSGVFLISDEFGFVPVQWGSDNSNPLSLKLKDCFLRLWQ